MTPEEEIFLLSLDCFVEEAGRGAREDDAPFYYLLIASLFYGEGAPAKRRVPFYYLLIASRAVAIRFKYCT